jgi:hypothetical protein
VDDSVTVEAPNFKHQITNKHASSVANAPNAAGSLFRTFAFLLGFDFVCDLMLGAWIFRRRTSYTLACASG